MEIDLQEKSDKKIVLILAYFGKFPNWISLFFGTCAHNKDVDWLIVTDNEICFPARKNIRFVRLSLNDLMSLFAKKTGTHVQILNPYKICDFKPAYGKIFEEYIEGYDFWGHIDCDIIWGAIRSFITGEMLTHYDIIMSHAVAVSGPFVLYRNTAKINALFSCQGYYREAFEATEYFNFDEIGSMGRPGFDGIVRESEASGQIRVLRKYLFAESCQEPSDWWLSRIEEITGVTVTQEQRDSFPSGACTWSQGRLFLNKNKQEIMFHHIGMNKKYYRRMIPRIPWSEKIVSFAMFKVPFCFKVSAMRERLTYACLAFLIAAATMIPMWAKRLRCSSKG